MPIVTATVSSSRPAPALVVARTERDHRRDGGEERRSCPQSHFAAAQASATATPACTIVRQPARTRSQRVRMETRERSAASSNSRSGITARDGTRPGPARAAARRTRARPAPSPRARRRHGRGRRRAACRGGSSRSPGAPPPRARAGAAARASPVPHHGGRTNSIHRCARPGDPHVRALALGRVRDADVPGGSPDSSIAIAHQVVDCAQPLADRADLEAVRRRLPTLRCPLAVGLEAQPGRSGERRGVIRNRDPDVQRRGVHLADSVAIRTRHQAQVEGEIRPDRV